jgi:hypothetical protein
MGDGFQSRSVRQPGIEMSQAVFCGDIDVVCSGLGV